MQLQFIRPRERFPTIRAGMGLRVECADMPPCDAVRVKCLVTPRTRIHSGDRIGMAGGMGSQNVHLVEGLIAKSTHVVFVARVRLAVAR